jgi:hypothetical protein
MAEGKQVIKPLLKEGLYDIFGGEDLLIDAARDLIREEIKDYIRKRLDASPELKKEFKDAIGMYFEAKLMEAFANIKLVKAGAKLGLEMIPKKMKTRMSKELEFELTKLLEKAL